MTDEKRNLAGYTFAIKEESAAHTQPTEEVFVDLANAEPIPESPTNKGTLSDHLAKERKQRFWTPVIGILITLISLIVINVVYDMTVLGTALFNASPWFGGLYLILSLALVIFLVLWIRIQFRSIAELKSVLTIREKLALGVDSDDLSATIATVHSLVNTYRNNRLIQQEIIDFEKSYRDYHTKQQVISVFSQRVLHPLDQKALAEIRQHSIQTLAFTTISPYTAVDIVVTIWRNISLTKKIAVVYGFRPSLAGTLVLTKHAMETLAVSGSIHYLSDIVAEALGNSILGKASTQLSQGTVNGLMTARFGLIVAEHCRPVGFIEAERPKIRDLLKNISEKQGTTHEPNKKTS